MRHVAHLPRMFYGVNVFPFRAQEIRKCVCFLSIGRYTLVTVNDSRKRERTWSHIQRKAIQKTFINT